MDATLAPLNNLFLQPVETGNPMSKLGVFEHRGRGTLGLIIAL